MIFWRMLVIKQLTVPIDFHSISFPTMEFNGDQQLSLKLWSVQHKKETYTGLEWHEGE